MIKIAATVGSVLVSLGLAAFYPPQPPDGDGPPPPKAKKKDDAKAKRKDEAKKKGERPGPENDLRKAYDLLRRLRADSSAAGRSEERLTDWVERAARYYRDGVKAFKDDDPRLAHEYGVIAHDLARTVEHARNAARFDQSDPDLPPPPAGDGHDETRERARRDLRVAYERITGMGDKTPKSADFAVKAAKDLYRAARKDAEAGRNDRAGELARAAEAITHVTEHLDHIEHDKDRPEHPAPPPPPPPGPEKKKGERRGDGELPPPLP